eukprot:1459077-Amphidinium_carterae.1
MKSTSSTKVNTVLTGVETATGMCIAISTSKKGATQYQISQLKKFVMENGFGGSILQVDNEPSILALVQQVAKELAIPWRAAPVST